MLGLAKLAPGPGNVALAKRPEPFARPGHVVLEVVAAGICGTDLHIVDDEFPSRPPVTLGHEVSGVVAELGDGRRRRLAPRARRHRDVLLDLRDLCVVPGGTPEPVPGAALDRLRGRRRLRAARARSPPGTSIASRAGSTGGPRR